MLKINSSFLIIQERYFMKRFLSYTLILLSFPCFGMELEKQTEHTEIRIISTLDGHREILRNAFETAKKDIIIVSPYVTKYALEADKIQHLVYNSVASNKVRITVYTDSVDVLKRKILTQINVEKDPLSLIDWRVVDKIHSKILIWDNDNFVCGSFNWLSSLRDPCSRYSYYETSTYLKGPKAVSAIQKIQSDLKKLEKNTLRRKVLGPIENIMEDYKNIVLEGILPPNYEKESGSAAYDGEYSKAAGWIIGKILERWPNKDTVKLDSPHEVDSQGEMRKKFMLNDLLHTMDQWMDHYRDVDIFYYNEIRRYKIAVLEELARTADIYADLSLSNFDFDSLLDKHGLEYYRLMLEIGVISLDGQDHLI